MIATRVRIVRAVLSLAASLIAIAAPCRAHDLGAMLIELRLGPGAIAVGEAWIDPSHLPPANAALMARGGQDPDRAELVERLRVGLERESRFATARGERVGVRAREIPSPQATPDLLCFSIESESAVGVGATWSSDAPPGQYLLRLVTSAGSASQWLKPGEASDPLGEDDAIEPGPTSAATGTLRVLGTYTRLGFTHILPDGLDHILFVLGLFLLSARLRPVLAQATAFTVAHSVSLALAMYGVVSPPAWIVEPLIAASIAFVGVENIVRRGYTSRRTLVAFAFGLLHGMGFAGALREVGLPREQFLPALLSFNLGVELGQVAVIGAAFLLVGAWFGRAQWYRARIAVPASACIAIVAGVWTVQRLGV